ncbi:MAG TPA: M67 family metallopeptidase [Chloroflexota bacterium]|nr:M67 family metallopeptidase [Chloroflexota bacterium]
MIRVAREVHQAMIAHALEERPFECCGVLAGSGGAITQSRRAKNAAELFGIRYEIDSREFMRLNREIDDADLDLIGIYHSHPFTRAYPSATDVGQAWEGLVYVIVSLTDFLTPVVKAFTIANGQVSEQPVEIV